MQIEIFSLCDAATTVAGKMNILGAFDVIWAAKVPAVHSQCTIALRIRFNALEGPDHKVVVKFVDADGHHVVPPANGKIKIDFRKGQRSNAANLVLNIQGLKVKQYGEYAIDLAVDGKNYGALPVFVRKPKGSMEGL